MNTRPQFVTLGDYTFRVDEILYVTDKVPYNADPTVEYGPDLSYVHLIPRPGGRGWIQVDRSLADIRAHLNTKGFLA